MLLSSILAFVQADGGQAAEAAENPGGGSAMTIMWIVILVLFVWMFLIKPMRDQKKRNAQLNALQKGTNVMTSSGIYGKIREVKDKAFVVQIADGVNITVAKEAVYPVDEQNASAEKK